MPNTIFGTHRVINRRILEGRKERREGGREERKGKKFGVSSVGEKDRTFYENLMNLVKRDEIIKINTNIYIYR